jgi:Spy/CpxP family protein refolding chaperone
MMGHMGHRGHMGPGWGYGYMGKEHGQKYAKFLDETRDLRRQLHMKGFEYMEALRQPEANQEALSKLREEMKELSSSIHDKAPCGR